MKLFYKKQKKSIVAAKGKELILVIKGRIPSKKNNKRIVGRGSRKWIKSSRKYELWEEEQTWLLKNKQVTTISQTKQIRIRFWFPDGIRTDLTNKAESIMDLLVNAGILADDNWQVVPNLILYFEGISRNNPRAEVQIMY